MDYAHWGLMALAFVLGLVLTFALMIRRVKVEVPVTTTGAAAGAGAAESKTAGSESETKKMPAVTEAPYGAGSARAGGDGSGPSGWLVKGNEQSKLYHTPDSPSYEQTVAEVWFKDEESAVQAGFAPWHKGKK
jgi:hypothetical protein